MRVFIIIHVHFMILFHFHPRTNIKFSIGIANRQNYKRNYQINFIYRFHYNMIRVLFGFASISVVHAVQMAWFKNQGNKFVKLLKPTWHKKRGRNDVKVNGDELVHEMQDERFRQLQAETLSEELWKKASEYAQEFPEEKFPDAKWDTLWNMAKLFFKRQKLQEKEISSK